MIVMEKFKLNLSSGKSLSVTEIINFNKADMLLDPFLKPISGLTKLSLFIHNSMPYIHPRPDMNI